MSTQRRIDLNSDVGEAGDAADNAILDLVTSANIACGYHAGNAATIDATVRAAKARDVAIGAHPSYPDPDGFGRRSMRIAPNEVEAMMLYQIGAVDAIARAHRVRLTHVKPHGALYNDAATDRTLADAIASAVRRLGNLRLVGLAGSALVEAAHAAGVPAVSEAFCDRAYESDGTLRPRAAVGAVITDPVVAARQAVSIAAHGVVRTFDGGEIAVAAQSLCIHGDTPGAVEIARIVRAALESAGVRVAQLE